MHHELHPLITLFYCTVFLVLSLSFTNPVILLALLIGIVLNIYRFKAISQLKAYLAGAIFLGILIIIVNIFVSSAGSTVLYEAAPFFLPFPIIIKLEPLVFSINMFIKIMLTFSIFCFYNAISDRDETLYICSKIAPKSSVTAMLASLMVPAMHKDVKRIVDVLITRGIYKNNSDKSQKSSNKLINIIKRIPVINIFFTLPVKFTKMFITAKNIFPLWKILLMSSLEGAWNISEAMHSKGFGSGKRTHCFPTKWQFTDSIILLFTFFAILCFSICLYYKTGFIKIYPTLTAHFFTKSIIYPTLIIFLCFSPIPFYFSSFFKKSFAQITYLKKINS